MSGFGDFFLYEIYTKIAGSVNKSDGILDFIDRVKLRPKINDIFRDTREIGGRSHNEGILMIRMPVLAGWHGLSDYEIGTFYKGSVIVPPFSRVSGKNA